MFVILCRTKYMEKEMQTVDKVYGIISELTIPETILSGRKDA